MSVLTIDFKVRKAKGNIVQFKEDYVYNAPIAQVWDLFKNPAYSKARATKLQMSDPQVQQAGGANDIETTTRGGIPSEMLPAAAAKFLGPNSTAVITEKWHRDGDKRIVGQIKVAGQGIPAELKATATLTPDGNKTKAVMEGEVSVHIPFLGRRLEKEAVKFAPELVKGEQETAAEFLAGK